MTVFFILIDKTVILIDKTVNETMEIFEIFLDRKKMKKEPGS